MKKNKAYKYRLYPNKEQQSFFDKTIGCVRFIYNLMLSDKIKHYKETGLSLQNTPAHYKDEYEWLKEVDSLALANAQQNLNSAYKNFFARIKKGVKEVGFPKFKSKKKAKWSYTTNNQKGTIAVEGTKIKLPKIGLVNVRLHRQIPKHYVIKSATITKTRTNKYYVSVLVEYENQVSPKDIETVVGLDFSMRELYVASDGSSANYPRYFRLIQEQLVKEQRSLSRKKYGSRGYEKQKLRVTKVHEKIANQRADFLHKKSRELVDQYDMVCIEDLNMQAMSQCLKFGKSVMDNGFGMFTSFLKYKLEDQGKKLFVIDKWFPSSKMCSSCGQIKEDLQLSDRMYSCDCGLEIDRDLNASINIKTVGTTELAQGILVH